MSTLTPTPTLPIAGGCVCGAFRYECTEPPMEMLRCHCRDCQQVTGGPYAAAVLVPTGAFKITRGTPKYHELPSEAGGMHMRAFCAECGCRLLGAVKEGSPFIGILASSLDDPSIFKPSCDIFVCDAQPWDAMEPELPKFDKYPPM